MITYYLIKNKDNQPIMFDDQICIFISEEIAKQYIEDWINKFKDKNKAIKHFKNKEWNIIKINIIEARE